MLKSVSFLLIILILFLSVQPCSDGLNLEDIHNHQVSNTHNHKQDTDDSCSPFCVCACCSVSVTFESNVAFIVTLPRIIISTKLNSFYASNYLFAIFSSVWHPPKQ